MGNNQQLGIHFGALCPKISEQLTTQGFKFNAEEVGYFEKEVDALIRLSICGYLTDKMKVHVQKKIYSRIEKHVMQQNKLHKVKAADTLLEKLSQKGETGE